MQQQTDNHPPYFEAQKSLANLCGVHAINNLLGYPACSEKTMNSLCYSLSADTINPHKHIFGGDYDANVLMLALRNIGCDCRWLDGRQIEAATKESMVPN